MDRVRAKVVARRFLLGVIRPAGGYVAPTVLLLLGVGLSAVRGASHRQTTTELAAIAWGLVPVALYLVAMALYRAVRVSLELRKWDAMAFERGGNAMLLMLGPPPAFAVSATRCVVTDASGARHEAISDIGTMDFLWNAQFPSTGVHPPHGRLLATWFVKELPSDGWMRVASGEFDYPAFS